MTLGRSVAYGIAATTSLFLISAPSFAQSNVTLYGVADAYVGLVKNAGVRNTVQNSGALNGSRWGLRGTEDLGGGLKANFVLESGITIDNGAAANGGATFSRQAYVGLAGGFGEVRLGRQYSAYDEIRGATNNVSDSGVFAATGGAWAAGGDYTNRIDNQIYYASPKFGGVTAAVGYGFSETRTPGPSPTGGVHRSTVSFNLKYATGPLLAAFAHQYENPVDGAPGSKYSMVAATYDFGLLRLVGAVNLASGPDKEREFQTGIEAPFGPFKLFAGVATSKAKTNAGALSAKGRSIGLLATYDLSKRTALYAGLNDTEREDAAGVKTADLQTLGAGIRHRF